MIKVNLLTGVNKTVMGQMSPGSVEVTADDEAVRRQGLKHLFIIFLPVIALYLYEMQKVPGLRTERQRLSTALEEMKTFNAQAEASVREIKKIKQDEEQIQKRIAALERLSKNRTTEVRVLKLFADVIPEKAWLNKIDMREGKAYLTGYAVNNSEVNTLAERLKSDIHIEDLQLVQMAEEKVEGMSLVKFEFACSLGGKK